jgi:NAD(P)-dependent dehydrogenase (short-subunit alcohol dehydrogenase family)
VNGPRSRERPDPLNEPVPDESLAAHISLGRQLATEGAEANFRSLTAAPGWTMAQVNAETELAVERMEIASRDLLTAKGADPDGEQWRAIWTVMENQYRQTMADLLRASGLWIGETLQ